VPLGRPGSRSGSPRCGQPPANGQVRDDRRHHRDDEDRDRQQDGDAVDRRAAGRTTRTRAVRRPRDLSGEVAEPTNGTPFSRSIAAAVLSSARLDTTSVSPMSVSRLTSTPV
jgi:hypothetical protein